jgi:hypothetical protein
MEEGNYPKPSTMVAVIYFDSFVYLENLFWTLPIIKDNSVFVKRAPIRARFNWIAKPGTLLAVKYMKRMRGMEKKDDKKTKQLKNNLNIDMSLNEKNINLNLGYSKKNGKASLQMTGVVDQAMIEEAYSFICRHLYNLQQKFDYLYLHPEVIEELRKNVKLRYDEPLSKVGLINQHNDVFFEIFHLMTSWQEFENYIDHISQIRYIYHGNFHDYSINIATVNYNYRLGFIVDRKKLAELIKRPEVIYSKYDRNDGHHDVGVVIPIDPTRITTPFKKPKIDPAHRFKIKKSGCVKQSSPNRTLGEEAVTMFMNAVRKIENEIKVQ